MNTIEIKAPQRYQNQETKSGSSQADRIYQSLCYVLSDRSQEVAWEEFGPQDWQLMGKMARVEEIAPIIYWKLKTCWPGGMPEDLRDNLAQAYYKNSGRNLWLFAELDRILIALEKAGVPVVVLKGPALATKIYEDPALRIMSDIDLLVPDELCEKAVYVVKALGYIEPIPEIGPGFNQELEYHVFLAKLDAIEFNLEIHWKLVAGSGYIYSAPVGWFWTQTEPWQNNKKKTNAKILNSTANLLFLTAHAMLQHGGSQVTLRGLYDVDRLIVVSGNRIDWNIVALQGERLGWTGALVAALEKSKELFNTPGVDGFIHNLPSDRLFQFLVNAKQTPAETTLIKVGRVLSGLKTTSRLRMVVSLLIPSPAYMRWRYRPHPQWLWPITYFSRWIDFGNDILKTVLKKSERIFTKKPNFPV